MTPPKIQNPIYDQFAAGTNTRAFVDGLADNDEKKERLLKNMPNSRLECKHYTQFATKVTTISTLFMTKTAENHTFWGRTYLYSSYLSNRPQVSMGYRLINHAGCWWNTRRNRKPRAAGE